MVAKFVKEEGIEEVVIRNVVIMFLLYVHDVFVTNTLEDEVIGRVLYAYSIECQ